MFLPSNITLKFGDSGDFVSELQRRLAMVKCFPENAVNGFFDGTTSNAVISFQNREGLTADGVAGPETLRRLNGVIAGDTSSSSSDNKQEEETQLASAAAQPMLPHEPEPLFNPAEFYAAAAPHTPYGEEAYRQPVQQQMEIAPPPHQPEPPRHEPPVQQHPGFAPAEHAQMHSAQHHQQPAQHQPFQPQHQPATQPHQPFQAAAQEPPTHQHAQPQQQTSQHAPEAQHQQTPAAAPGIGGRIRQFANAMMQKLSDYFEAKLPPSVLSEVQSIGVVMARSGMREAPIPTGPEMPGRGQELPERGPQQGQHRG